MKRCYELNSEMAYLKEKMNNQTNQFDNDLTASKKQIRYLQAQQNDREKNISYLESKVMNLENQIEKLNEKVGGNMHKKYCNRFILILIIDFRKCSY
jgi:peptidoglycan hydrolase CwlO-like protein